MTKSMSVVSHWEDSSLALWSPYNISVQLRVVAVIDLRFMVRLVLNFALHNSRDKSIHQ